MPSTPTAGPSASDSVSFLDGGGEMAALVRDFDWNGTTLGPPQDWPQSLKTAVGIMLSSKFPMFVAWGPELRFLYNDGYSEVLGGKHPAALGGRFEDIWFEIWPDISPLVDRALAGEATYWRDLPLVMMRKGYEEKTWFTFSYSPLRGDDGAVAGMFCACVETTDTVLAERRRIDEAQRLEQLFDRSPSFMTVLRGPEHIFEMLNQAYLQLVGHRNLIGRPAREALPEVVGQGFFELLDEVYASGKPFTGRSMKIHLQRAPDASPEERLLDFVFQPIADADGRISGVFVEGYDVTERHLAELALRESEERFRLIADSAPVPMWVTRLDRTRSFANRAYVDFLGISYEDAIDFDWRTIVHPDDAARILADSVAGEESLKPFVLEGRYRRGDGQWRWLRSESQPRWGPQGEHIGFIGVAHDITDSKHAEAALREVNETLERRVAERTADLSAALDRLQAEVGERERAEEALRQAQKMEAVGQLTGGIAHDFNNLLTPIMGGLDIIANKVEDPRLKRIADAALESTRRGARLTSQLLAFSRIQRISMAPVAVNDVIGKMGSLLRQTIGGAIRIDTLLDRDVQYAVCDANQLENAILNLAINARDAMPDGGSLSISTSRTSLHDAPDIEAGDFVCISVADSGEGMSPEVAERATEPFFSTKPLGKGTGLGLAQVYGIARQSGGTLRIESGVGIGTRIDLFLPAAEAGAAVAEGDTAAQADLDDHDGGAAIMIVDDDSDVRSFLADSLEGLGHKVRMAEDGEAALETLASWEPDLMLLDYAMPLMHGGEVARKARAFHPALPIIFVTGYAETEQLEAALGPSVDILRKPFSVSGLAAAIDKVLKRKCMRP
ncbi:PAS domain-containing protein [Sphingosinicella rhizophila]|uniref:histidine kinase n=1 Tax=Sphingosinicella rhizophila TaxID=3050082 RepID=A0ABU3Q7P7_9SPHN|nr:PAS domain-containing protein [Sphingosinicella sp. GR2756]MDT9599435.1 PAS domain-containing protein [Sphingosinicella sp. GR2756]